MMQNTDQNREQNVVEPSELRRRWEDLKSETPAVRTRRAAEQLGVSEAELIATRCGDGVTRLQGDWKELICDLPKLDQVMALTRNEQAVHEVTGRFDEISFDSHVGLVLGEEIDLRLFMTRWHHGFAVESETKRGVRRSLQFFDADGMAVHKVYLKGGSDLDAYQALVDSYRSEDQSGRVEVREVTKGRAETPDEEIDVEAFRADWEAMEDTHQFFGILRKHDVRRTQALRLAPKNFAEPVETQSAVRALELARDGEVPIMIFVGSRGCVQIFTGQVKKLVRAQGWFNVLDPGFNLHLRDDEIAQAWIVRKPTVDGLVTALELFDADGGIIAQVFGKRKPGIAEDERWRAVVSQLSTI